MKPFVEGNAILLAFIVVWVGVLVGMALCWAVGI